MGNPVRWLDERIDLGGIRAALLDRPVPDRLTWWHTMGSATLTVFVLQVVTGVVLATYYVPSPDHAYNSIRFIEREVWLGGLIRGVHHWAATAMVILVVAHMIRVFSMGAYKYPREANWILGVILFVLVLGFSFTGYLLPWDQKAYWATAVGTNMAGSAPGVGALVAALLRGGETLGAATLARFYAFHVLWLPAAIVLVILLHLTLVIRQGIAPLPKVLEKDAPRRTDDASYPAYYREAYAASKRAGFRFWPDVIAKDALVSLATVAILVVLALVAGAGLEAPADPTDTTYVPRPEWYFLPLYELLKLFPGSMESIVAVGVPTALFAALLLLPFFDHRSRRNLLGRPVALASLAVLMAGSGFLFGRALRGMTPAADPATMAILSPAQRAGRAHFQSQQCSMCHRIGDEGMPIGPDLTEVGLRHSSAWMHSFIEEPGRFHPDTRMPRYGPPRLSHQEIEELALYLSTLRGSNGATPEFRDTFPE